MLQDTWKCQPFCMLFLVCNAEMQPELAALQRQGLEELVYAYVACMAVRASDRRKGIASALLSAAERQVRISNLPLQTHNDCQYTTRGLSSAMIGHADHPAMHQWMSHAASNIRYLA